MDIYTATETAYKNGYKKGYEVGYVKGVLDRIANAMKGTIEWHEDEPAEDQHYCYICVKDGEGKYVIRPAAYVKKHRIYLADGFEDDGSYCQKRLDRREIFAWAKLRDPFSMKATFAVSEEKK